MSHDAVYVYKSDNRGGKELRHSLRSLSNLKLFSGKVFIVGDSEQWFSDKIIHIPVQSIYGDYCDSENKWRIACQDDRISDYFWLMNDDFYIRKPTEIVPAHNGIIRNLGTDRYHYELVKHTGRYLERQGVTEPLSYELHIPMLMKRNRRLMLSDIILPTVKSSYPLLARSLYGNLYETGGEHMADVKTYTNRLPSTTMMSSDYYTDELAILYPDKSQYEA